MKIAKQIKFKDLVPGFYIVDTGSIKLNKINILEITDKYIYCKVDGDEQNKYLSTSYMKKYKYYLNELEENAL
jgi:hypothetical protein